MELFGVVNASPDSLNEDSIVDGPASAARRAASLLADGADAFDLGGQGSTFKASQRSEAEEWASLSAVLPTLAATGRPVSVDTWRPSLMRRALDSGASWINAAEGLQDDEMLAVAAEFDCPVVAPFLSGPDPLNLAVVRDRDPMATVLEFFEHTIGRARRFGVERNLVLDPGTGFAPHDWPWEERFVYQRLIYSQVDRLRIFGLPLYIALPWKETDQHAELLDIVVRRQPEYGRAHYPARIRAAEAAA
ncbi:MAG: dihydropteroate synthase [Acidimicrobiia bacterium]|nr:dihydropteroate synthase [Acidimicrobiia bacterium]